ncbi:type VI secretion system contractile sheath large subunit [Uliginosibacterium sediminicola]|uniref:Type VI secretion system contractile sheath large subunit n=1 Tax=Uliginosibacterium sediminicola TaxID=2024550 RepID=A0ABU9Z199_9RHOO
MSESIQKKLLRVRPPRVRITYDVESAGSIEKRELPFIVGIFAELSGDADAAGAFKTRQMLDIDRDNFDAVLRACAPRVSLAEVADLISGGGAMLQGALSFSSLADFEPLSIVRQLDVLNRVFVQRTALRSLQAHADADERCAQQLSAIFSAAPDGRDRAVQALASEYVAEHLDALQAALTTYVLPLLADTPAAAPQRLLDQGIARIDALLSQQLSLIMHAPSFQRLEASWRGLHRLVAQSETGANLKLRVFNASKQAVYEDLEKAVEFDQSHLFKLIYEAEFGTLGGEPYSVLMADYEVGRSAEDLSFLRKMAAIAAAANAPFITAAAPDLFDLRQFADLRKPRTLSKIFESVELSGWRDFRDSEDARYVALVLPRVLMRLPYGHGTEKIAADGVCFEEELGPDAAQGPAPERLLWGNAAYLLVERITQAFATYGWPAAISGVEGGGLVEGLPYWQIKDDGDVAGRPRTLGPTELDISLRRERELRDLGFIALCHRKGEGSAAFLGTHSSQQARKNLSDGANADAAMACSLPYMLVSTRIAHYVKVMIRDKIGSFLTRANVEQFLNAWVAQYVLLDEDAPAEVKAAFPLRFAQISVEEVPGAPGSYKSNIFIKPHFQLGALASSIHIVADLPA